MRVGHSSQLLKGVLDMCLLALIDQEPSYGYEMVAKLQRNGLELVSEGTIYPLLSRLQKQGFIEGYFVESTGGPPRKYYRIAEKGREQLGDWRAEWRGLSTGVEEVLNGASSE
jgi:PadR family transcriptional regulator PadR